MTKAEQGPRQYSVQDHLDMAGHFTYNVSTDQDEIDTRHANAGKGVNIVDDQAFGTEVAVRTLSSLDDLEDASQWAELVGVAELNSGLYVMRKVDPRMYRNVPLPEMLSVDEGVGSMARFRVKVRKQLASNGSTSTEHVRQQLEGKLTTDSTERFARQLLGNAIRLSAWGLEFSKGTDEPTMMAAVKARTIAMHDKARTIARATGINPSLAQLRSSVTPFGVHIVTSTKEYSPRVIRAFKDTSNELGSSRGYN